MTQSATLKRPTATSGTGGIASRTFATVSTFAAALWPLGSNIDLPFRRRDFVGDHVFATDADRDARPGDRIECGGISYEIHSGNAFTLGARTVYVIDTTRIQTS